MQILDLSRRVQRYLQMLGLGNAAIFVVSSDPVRPAFYALDQVKRRVEHSTKVRWV